MAKPKTIPHSRALEIQEDIAAWMRTQGAYEHMGADHLSMVNRRLGEDVWSPDDVMNKYGEEIYNSVLHECESFAKTTPTFCSSDFGTMLLAMSETAPPGNIGPSELSAAHGLLIFSEPIAVPASGPRDYTHRGVRALSFDVQGNRRLPVLFVRYWSEGGNSEREASIPGRNKLRAGHVCVTPLSDNVAETDFGLVRLLRSYFALLKSPVADEAVEPRNPKISPRTKRSLPTDSIRRVYLRHPEHARYEADEAAAAREGRAPVRAHWVRGHWRNQPYPKTGEVKWIWIDGYIKGNPENGTVTTRKLQVARASRAEVRELVGV